MPVGLYWIFCNLIFRIVFIFYFYKPIFLTCLSFLLRYFLISNRIPMYTRRYESHIISFPFLPAWGLRVLFFFTSMGFQLPVFYLFVKLIVFIRSYLFLILIIFKIFNYRKKIFIICTKSTISSVNYNVFSSFFFFSQIL